MPPASCLACRAHPASSRPAPPPHPPLPATQPNPLRAAGVMRGAGRLPVADYSLVANVVDRLAGRTAAEQVEPGPGLVCLDGCLSCLSQGAAVCARACAPACVRTCSGGQAYPGLGAGRCVEGRLRARQEAHAATCLNTHHPEQTCLTHRHPLLFLLMSLPPCRPGPSPPLCCLRRRRPPSCSGLPPPQQPTPASKPWLAAAATAVAAGTMAAGARPPAGKRCCCCGGGNVWCSALHHCWGIWHGGRGLLERRPAPTPLTRGVAFCLAPATPAGGLVRWLQEGMRGVYSFCMCPGGQVRAGLACLRV